MHVGKNSFKQKYSATNTNFRQRRHTTDAEMNAESVKYGYFLETEVAFVVHFFKVRRQDTSILYWASLIASHTLPVYG